MYQGFLISLSLYILYHSTKYYANFASLRLFCFLYFIFNNSPAKLNSLLDFERGFRPACEIRTGIFDPRTTFCRPGTSRFPLINCYPWRYWYSFVAIFSFFFLVTKNTRQTLHLQHPWNPRQSLLYYYSSISFLITLRFVRLRPVLITGDASWFYFLFKIP